MQDVLNKPLEERRPIEIDEAEDAILAMWEDPDDQASDDDEQEAHKVVDGDGDAGILRELRDRVVDGADRELEDDEHGNREGD